MRKELIAERSPKSPIAEIFRTLRTNIQFMNSQKSLRTILITSTMPGEGKTWVSSNLAITFAQAGKRVLLIDADLRKGRLHKVFQLEAIPGLSNYLSGMDENDGKLKNDILKYVRRTEVNNLFVITAGNFPPNPSELLASETTTNMIENLKKTFDIIILDGTPCLLVTDSVILSRMVDSTIIVASHKTTKKDDLAKVKKSIENVGGKIAGVVLNKVPVNIDKYESTYYYSSSTKSDVIDSVNVPEQEDRINFKGNIEGIDNIQEEPSIASEYDVETSGDISKERTEEIMKQIDDFLKKNNK